jgi:hypothetical protein
MLNRKKEKKNERHNEIKKKEDMKGDLHTVFRLGCWQSAQSELPCGLLTESGGQETVDWVMRCAVRNLEPTEGMAAVRVDSL